MTEPVTLGWARGLDEEDRAEFLADVARAASDGDLDALERHLDEWRMTAVALADPALREALAGPLDPADFTEVQRPGGEGLHG